MKFSNIDINHVTSKLLEYRVILVWLVVLGLLGFTLWRATIITDPQVDEEHMRVAEEDAAEEVELDLDAELETRINQLEPGAIDISLDGRGDRDPFNP